MNDYVKRIEQVVAEDTYSRTAIHGLIKAEIEEDINGPLKRMYLRGVANIQEYMDQKYFESKDIRILHLKSKDVYKVMLDLIIATLTAYRPLQIQGIANELAMSLKYKDIFDGVKTAAELLAVCSNTGLYEIWTNPIELQSNLALNASTLETIERFKYLNPMKVRPDDWSDNTNGGYVTVKSHAVLKPHNKHYEEQNLNALNQAQSIAYELDWDVLKEGELSKKPLDTQEKREGFERLKRMTEMSCKEIGKDKFYWVYKYDSRGRMYSQGYQINIQSNEYRKAMISFHKKQLIK